MTGHGPPRFSQMAARASRPQPSPHLEWKLHLWLRPSLVLLIWQTCSSSNRHSPRDIPSTEHCITRRTRSRSHRYRKHLCDRPPLACRLRASILYNRIHRAHQPLRIACKDTSHQSIPHSTRWQKSAHCRKGGTLCWMTTMRLNVRRDRE